MVLANGKTARDVDDKLAMYGHGIRFRDRYTMNTLDEERTSQAKNKPLNLYNLFTKTSDKKVATLGHMFRPGEPPAREMVPLRVIVIDCSGERAPVDVAIDVRRARDVAADVVDAIRKKCGVSDAEKVILAACEYLSPEARKPDDTTRLERSDVLLCGAPVLCVVDRGDDVLARDGLNPAEQVTGVDPADVNGRQ